MESLRVIKMWLLMMECIFFAMSLNIPKEGKKICFSMGCLFMIAVLFVIAAQAVYGGGLK